MMSKVAINMDVCRLCGSKSDDGQIFNDEEDTKFAKKVQATFSALVSVYYCLLSPTKENSQSGIPISSKSSDALPILTNRSVFRTHCPSVYVFSAKKMLMYFTPKSKNSVRWNENGALKYKAKPRCIPI